MSKELKQAVYKCFYKFEGNAANKFKNYQTVAEIFSVSFSFYLDMYIFTDYS